MSIQDLYKQTQQQVARAAQQQRAKMESAKSMMMRARQLMAANRDSLANRVRAARIVAKAAELADQ